MTLNICVGMCLFQTKLYEWNAKQAQFRILPRYKVKAEGDVVSIK